MSRVYYEKNKEKVLQQQREYYKQNVGKIRETARAYYKQNRDQILKQKKQYNQEHSEERSEGDRKRHISHPENSLWNSARKRCRKSGLEFSITKQDIIDIIPDRCPVFGTPWRKRGSGRGPDSMSLDRIDNTKGYVSGNIAIISSKANLMKSSGTLEDVLLLAKWLVSKAEEKGYKEYK